MGFWKKKNPCVKQGGGRKGCCKQSEEKITGMRKVKRINNNNGLRLKERGAHSTGSASGKKTSSWVSSERGRGTKEQKKRGHAAGEKGGKKGVSSANISEKQKGHQYEGERRMPILIDPYRLESPLRERRTEGRRRMVPLSGPRHSNQEKSLPQKGRKRKNKVAWLLFVLEKGGLLVRGNGNFLTGDRNKEPAEKMLLLSDYKVTTTTSDQKKKSHSMKGRAYTGEACFRGTAQ